jgi:hypothetical protein
MKYLKMLGLVAVAAMALTAFSVGTASATTLDGNGAVLKAGSTIETSLAAGKSAKFTNTEETLTLETCTAGTMTGTISNETGTTVTGSVAASGLTWGTGATPCTNTIDTVEGGTLHIEHTTGNNGVVTGTGFKWTTFVASLGTTCSYGFGTGTTLGTLVGGKPATLAINTAVKGAAGNSFLCPASAKWVGEYTVTNPAELLVTA